MDVLIYLARRQGELVSREDLERDVWQGALVGYDAITGTIIKLRKALQDSARAPRFIETIPKRGYRLIAPVDFGVFSAAQPSDVSKKILRTAVSDPVRTEPEPSTAPAAGEAGTDALPGAEVDRRRIKGTRHPAVRLATLMVGAVLMVALIAKIFVATVPQQNNATGAPRLPDGPSLAVLPFQNLSDDPADDYFSDGITDDLITDLSQLPDLFLISRHSSFSYKSKAIDPVAVGRELGVRFLVAGSVRRSGDKLRVNVQLLDASGGQQLWAQRFDRPAADVFVVQDQINARILDALSVQLTESDSERLRGRNTSDPSAYDAYLKGISHYWRATAQDYELALGYLQQATDLDPGYTDAHAAMAAVYWQAYKRGLNRNQPWLGLYWERIMEALQKALQRPSALAYLVDSGVYTSNRRYELAISQARTAVERFPNDALSHLALADALSFAGRPAEARMSAERGLRLDPRRPAPYLFALGRSQFESNDFANAVSSLEQAVNLNPSDALPRTLLVSALAHLDRKDEARRQLADLESLYREEGMRRLNLRDLAQVWPYRNQEDLERIRRGLRAVDVPEW
jgi:TolB-like protein/DNA-binding winged helix-turn-helix (wHTH) protein/Tfp pilus assembly protein PilF